MTRYFEDFPVGAVFELGEAHLSEEQMVAFAREYDPQPFHVDPTAAREHPFGGLVASGLQTFAVFNRLFVDSLMRETANLGGASAEMQWLGPIRPGDLLRARTRVLEARPSLSKRDRGVVKFLFELENAEGEVPWRATSTLLIARRP